MLALEAIFENFHVNETGVGQVCAASMFVEKKLTCTSMNVEQNLCTSKIVHKRVFPFDPPLRG